MNFNGVKKLVVTIFVLSCFSCYAAGFSTISEFPEDFELPHSAGKLSPVFEYSDREENSDSVVAVKLREDLRESVVVDCFSEHMIAVLNRSVFDRWTDWKFDISLNDEENRRCHVTPKTSNFTHFKLPSLYNYCKTAKVSQGVRDVYKNQIIITGSSSANGISTQMKLIQGFYCDAYLPTENGPPGTQISQQSSIQQVAETSRMDLPNPDHPSLKTQQSSLGIQDQESRLNLTFQLLLYDTPWDGSSTPWVMYPHEIHINRRVYVELKFDQDVQDEDLKAVVDSCYFGGTSNARDLHKHSLISGGCPVMNAQSEEVALHNSRDGHWHRSTRFSFKMSGEIFREKMFMFFHCRVTACSLSGGREEEGYKKCVSSTYCSEKSIGASNVPVTQRYAYYSTGLLRPVSSKITRKPEQVCTPCASTQKSTPVIQEQVVLKGVEFWTVVGISVASFFVGMLLVAALWWAHEKTRPSNYLVRSISPRTNRSRESGLSSSVDSGRTSNACSTSNTPPPNVMTPFII